METLQAQTDKITSEFLDSFGSLSTDELQYKPAPTVWSIAENIQHLIAVNESYYPIFELVEKGENNVPILGKVRFLVSFLGKMILQSVQPDRKRKMKTFPIWEPLQSKTEADVLKKFAAQQEILKKWIIRLEQWVINDTVIYSPANKNIVYTLSQAFQIILTHELRHLEQAKEVLHQLRKE